MTFAVYFSYLKSINILILITKVVSLCWGNFFPNEMNLLVLSENGNMENLGARECRIRSEAEDSGLMTAPLLSVANERSEQAWALQRYRILKCIL